MSVKGPYSFEYARIAVPDVEATKGWYEKYVGVDSAGKTTDTRICAPAFRITRSTWWRIAR